MRQLSSVWGKFAYNYTREIGKCINNLKNMGINDDYKIAIENRLMDGKYEDDWVTFMFCQERCDNEANLLCFLNWLQVLLPILRKSLER